MNERTLREIYLPGFEAAVTEGGCFTVMGASTTNSRPYRCHNDTWSIAFSDEWAFDGRHIGLGRGQIHDGGGEVRLRPRDGHLGSL